MNFLIFFAKQASIYVLISYIYICYMLLKCNIKCLTSDVFVESSLDCVFTQGFLFIPSEIHCSAHRLSIQDRRVWRGAWVNVSVSIFCVCLHWETLCAIGLGLITVNYPRSSFNTNPVCTAKLHLKHTHQTENSFISTNSPDLDTERLKWNQCWIQTHTVP